MVAINNHSKVLKSRELWFHSVSAPFQICNLQKNPEQPRSMLYIPCNIYFVYEKCNFALLADPAQSFLSCLQYFHSCFPCSVDARYACVMGKIWIWFSRYGNGRNWTIRQRKCYFEGWDLNSKQEMRNNWAPSCMKNNCMWKTSGAKILCFSCTKCNSSCYD